MYYMPTSAPNQATTFHTRKGTSIASASGIPQSQPSLYILPPPRKLSRVLKINLFAAVRFDNQHQVIVVYFNIYRYYFTGYGMWFMGLLDPFVATLCELAIE